MLHNVNPTVKDTEFGKQLGSRTNKKNCHFRVVYNRKSSGFYHVTNFTLGHENHPLLYNLSGIPLSLKIDVPDFVRMFSLFIHASPPRTIRNFVNGIIPTQLSIGEREAAAIKEAEKKLRKIASNNMQQMIAILIQEGAFYHAHTSVEGRVDCVLWSTPRMMLYLTQYGLAANADITYNLGEGDLLNVTVKDWFMSSVANGFGVCVIVCDFCVWVCAVVSCVRGVYKDVCV
jgi:hypothetical protein